jgi:hypothetical protein
MVSSYSPETENSPPGRGAWVGLNSVADNLYTIYMANLI